MPCPGERHGTTASCQTGLTPSWAARRSAAHTVRPNGCSGRRGRAARRAPRGRSRRPYFLYDPRCVRAVNEGATCLLAT
eukprot:7382064-Prymnesium_polylepis.2